MNNIEKMSEMGTVWIFNRALVGNRVYNDVSDIKKDPKFYELKKIWNNQLDEKWINSYYKQQKEMLQKFGNSEWTRFRYGTGSFMDFIKEILYSINKNSTTKLRYEQWNPSDIWMIKKGSITKIKKIIKNNTKGKAQTIYELNDLLAELIKEKELIGISLKKIKNKEAKFIYVNINIEGIESLLETNNKNLKVKEILYKLDKMEVLVKFENSDYIQITNNSGSNKKDNLKFEVNLKSSGGKGGKASVKNVIELLGNYGKTFKNNYREYPQNITEYIKEENQNNYKEYFNTIKAKGYVNGNVSFEKFTDTILNYYKTRPYLAITKLMQLKFLYLCSIIEINKVEEFWGDLYYLGLKVGDKFAPHGKLY